MKAEIKYWIREVVREVFDEELRRKEYSMTEAAEYIGCGKDRLRTLIRKGFIQTVPSGKVSGRSIYNYLQTFK